MCSERSPRRESKKTMIIQLALLSVPDSTCIAELAGGLTGVAADRQAVSPDGAYAPSAGPPMTS